MDTRWQLLEEFDQPRKFIAEVRQGPDEGIPTTVEWWLHEAFTLCVAVWEAENENGYLVLAPALRSYGRGPEETYPLLISCKRAASQMWSYIGRRTLYQGCREAVLNRGELPYANDDWEEWAVKIRNDIYMVRWYFLERWPVVVCTIAGLNVTGIRMTFGWCFKAQDAEWSDQIGMTQSLAQAAEINRVDRLWGDDAIALYRQVSEQLRERQDESTMA